jgi:hypothetical protein
MGQQQRRKKIARRSLAIWGKKFMGHDLQIATNLVVIEGQSRVLAK